VGKEKIKLMIQEEPYFTCESCGYEDYMGNTEFCPICDPGDYNDQDICFFVDSERILCRQDGDTCPHFEERSWDDCEKLEGFQVQSR
jgi:hypothetical protein